VKLILLLADPFSTPISKMLPLFNRGFPQTPIIGGMASAAAKPGDNRLLYNGRVLEQGAVGLLMSGRIDVQCTVSQGCRPIGKPLVITKSQRHVVQQLSGRNALEVVQEMVRKLSAEDRQLVQSHGLLVGRVINEYKSRFGRGDFLIRSISGVDEESGYIGVADTAVRTGQTVQFQVRDKQTAEQDLAFLLEAQKLHGQAGAALLFSCNGRGTRLFDEPDTDARILRQALGPVPLVGCFAAGEIGPVGEENFLHGHTVSLVTFRAQ
jgi:small ligand-binding sensory domain FIST